MTLFLLPLLLAIADTGRAGPVAPDETFVIYSESAVNREGTATHDAPPVLHTDRGSDGRRTLAPPHDRWFGEDKFKHLAFSYLVTVGTFGATRLAADHDASLTVATVAGAAAGIGKEIYDAKRQGVSLRDLLWDAIGITAAVLIAQETR